MKHTYLYRLPVGSRWLWTAGRAGAEDLFMSPETGDGTDPDWQAYIGLSDHLGHMRDLLHKAIEDQPRVCIGKHYAIPGSPAAMSDCIVHGRIRRPPTVVKARCASVHSCTSLGWKYDSISSASECLVGSTRPPPDVML